MKRVEVSRATVGRIPAYLKHLKNLDPAIVNISATALAKELGLGEVQVRKDLNAVSGAGRPKTGYLVTDLITALESFLCTDQSGNAVIVGAGKLGCALLDYTGFAEYGLSISAAFDKAAESISTAGLAKPVYPMSMLGEYCREKDIYIGIIAVPAAAAQAVCDSLVQSGVRAIWCFAPCRLSVPENIPVQYENMALSLAFLRTKINEI